jgi:hypothetical protein
MVGCGELCCSGSQLEPSLCHDQKAIFVGNAICSLGEVEH